MPAAVHYWSYWLLPSKSQGPRLRIYAPQVKYFVTLRACCVLARFTAEVIAHQGIREPAGSNRNSEARHAVKCLAERWCILREIIKYLHLYWNCYLSSQKLLFVLTANVQIGEMILKSHLQQLSQLDLQAKNN